MLKFKNIFQIWPIARFSCSILTTTKKSCFVTEYGKENVRYNNNLCHWNDEKRNTRNEITHAETVFNVDGTSNSRFSGKENEKRTKMVILSLGKWFLLTWNVDNTEIKSYRQLHLRSIQIDCIVFFSFSILKKDYRKWLTFKNSNFAE